MKSMKIIDEDKYNHILYLFFFILILNLIPILGIKSYGISVNYVLSAVLIFVASIVYIVIWIKHEKYIRIDSNGVAFFKNKLFKNSVMMKWEFKFEDFDKLSITASKTISAPKNPSLDIIEFCFYRGNTIVQKEIIFSKLDSYKSKKIKEILDDANVSNVLIINSN
jgi:hypothetical protein